MDERDGGSDDRDDHRDPTSDGTDGRTRSPTADAEDIWFGGDDESRFEGGNDESRFEGGNDESRLEDGDRADDTTGATRRASADAESDGATRSVHETERPGGDPTGNSAGDDEPDNVAASLGVIVATIALLGVVEPLRDGIGPLLDASLGELAVAIAAGCALLAIASFLGRRRSLLDRHLGGPIAGLASLAVVILTGFALNQGVSGTIVLPGIEPIVTTLSVPTVFLTFLAAALAVGLAAADFAGVSAWGLRRRTAVLGQLAVVAAAGWFGIQIGGLLIAIPLLIALGDLTTPQLVVVSQFGLALGMGGVAAGYIYLQGHDWSFVDLRVPNLWDVAWTVGGLIAIFVALFGISLVMNVTGVETAEHGTVEFAQQNPEILLVLIPASILVIGPFEELLFRNVIQKAMYGAFSRYGAVVAASVLFAVVHVAAYATAGAGAVMASLAIVFGLSLVLGTLYERTDNLLVPSVVHGVYNAILFASLYYTYG